MQENSVAIVENNFKISKNYEESLDTITKKKNGIYYTPKNIVEYIVKNTIKKHDILNNPSPKIADISCGCGNFLLEVYDALYDILEENMNELQNIYGKEVFTYDKIHEHILKNCIYGCDKDKDAIDILINSLINKNEEIIIEIKDMNIYCEDALKKEWNIKFDYIVGNPPYIGHKLLDTQYKKYILKEYSDVYKDKSDLYFCFYKKMIDITKKSGTVSIITPRYFIESISGNNVRNYITQKSKIIQIVDFLGCSIFKKTGVSSCIITLNIENPLIYEQGYDIDILKIANEEVIVADIDDIDYEINNTEVFDRFKVSSKKLQDEWLILKEEEFELYKNIEKISKYKLGDIVESFQGIITGCDKAFILKQDDINIENIDEKLLKEWVKNKNIEKYKITPSEKKLIYSNDIKDENKYENILNNIIGIHKNKLQNRRECRKNIRKWYELQWGRDKENFERIKIMYPYKASSNKFAIDYNNSFCSADVYSFYIKDKYTKEFSYEYLVALLNSKTYERYFKMTAKKMSKNVYDYYPNKVMKMYIFKDENYDKIESEAIKIIKLTKEQNEYDQNELEKLYNSIERLIIDSLNSK